MVALRRGSKRHRGISFGLWTLAFVLLPATVGPQDLAAQIKPALAMRRPPHSSFSFLHLATFGALDPIGAAMAKPIDADLARLAPHNLEDEAARAAARSGIGANEVEVSFPLVDRRHKGDALVLPRQSASVEAEPVRADNPITGLAEDDDVWPELGTANVAATLNPAMDMARLYFGPGVMDAPLSAFERDEDVQSTPESASSNDAANAAPATAPETAKPRLASLAPEKSAETVAGKGQVTGVGKHPQSPAERLGLTGKKRAHAEKCLANAVYFESRGESVRGQIAVAQVVMNRVFSEFYPDNVCDVVYQNANRHLACQFTFACDGIPDIVTEPTAWRRAKRIAKDMLDGELWLPEVGKATHYHAYWVHPYWVHEMKKLYKLGVHTFYRPRAWGDGSDEPSWGDPKTTAKLAKKL